MITLFCKTIVIAISYITLSIFFLPKQSIGSIESLKSDEIALLQFDSRPLKGYWLAAAQWNNYYCQKHGHVFIYYTSTLKNRCKHELNEEEQLASPWCKVKAMLQANYDYPNIKVFIYMDSDAVIHQKFEKFSILNFLQMMKRKLNWNENVKPIVFNQDGACWWCDLVKRVGYSACLNAGTVLWYRHEFSLKVLNDWWVAALDPYEGNPIKRRFRIKWPWEQDRQMAIYNRSYEYIQIASQPDQPFMSMKARFSTNTTTNWCLSHIPHAQCFISHHCENAYSKGRLIKLYQVPSQFSDAYKYKYGFEIRNLQ